MKQFRQYLFPAGLCLAVFCAFFLLGTLPTETWRKKAKPMETVEMEMPYRPAGRMLHVIVEGDGAYFGEKFVPFVLFEKTLEEDYGNQHIAWALVEGTDDARYGGIVTVYTSIVKVLKIPTRIGSIYVPLGTRLNPIEVHEFFQIY